jgi:hypothetical protein
MNLKGMQEHQRWASQNIRRIRTLNNEVQKSLTSPKTVEDFVKKSAQFGYGRTGSQFGISTSGGANT